METKIQNLGKLDEVKLFFDPLRKDDSFIVLTKTNEIKTGFMAVSDDNATVNAVLESNANIKWENVSSIIGGFASVGMFEKIKTIINS